MSLSGHNGIMSADRNGASVTGLLLIDLSEDLVLCGFA